MNIIIIKDQTGHPRKSPMTIRLRRVPRGHCMIIRKTTKKTESPPKLKKATD